MPDSIITRLRIEKHMTQAQLAVASGIHVQNISKIERGDKPIENLRLSTALALADALGVDPHRLLED